MPEKTGACQCVGYSLASLDETRGICYRSTEHSIPRCRGGQVSLVGLVASGKETVTRNGVRSAPMLFLSFEDEFSLYETVLFPPVFRRYRRLIDGGGVFLLSGTVEQDMGASSVTVRRISSIQGSPSEKSTSSFA